MNESLYYTQQQLQDESNRCLGCLKAPCAQKCPVGCCPRTFIAYVKMQQFQKAVDNILQVHPLAQSCALVCPHKFCMSACTRAKIDAPVNIPKIQASIMHLYRTPENTFAPLPYHNGKRVAVIGGGPAGLAAASVFVQLGYHVFVYEATDRLGGCMNLIPPERLPKGTIEQDWFYVKNENVTVHLNTMISDPQHLEGFDGILIAIGENQVQTLNIPGEEHTLSYRDYLMSPERYAVSGKVAVIGGGSSAADCALVAKRQGAKEVFMFVRRSIDEMRIDAHEKEFLTSLDVHLMGNRRLLSVEKNNRGLLLSVSQTRSEAGHLVDVTGSVCYLSDFAQVITALGNKRMDIPDEGATCVYAGDCQKGSSTVAEAIYAGKKKAFELHQKIITQEK